MNQAIELIAVLNSLACTCLYAKQKSTGWPLGYLSLILYGYLFFKAGLYANMTLQFIFIALQSYGWWQRSVDKSKENVLEITHLTPKLAIKLITLVIIFTILISSILKTNSHAALVTLDAFLMVSCLTNQWLLAQKILENWLIWLVIDTGYIILFAEKHLYLSAMLYTVYLVIAMYAYVTWKHQYDGEARIAPKARL